MTTDQPLIKVQNLKKYFKVPIGMNHAVDEVSFEIRRGRTLGVVGESGCGKSTLGRSIIRLLEATDGSVLLDGKDITHVKGQELKKAREKMQIVFQDPYSSLNPRLRIEATIMEPLKHSGRFSSKGKMKEEANRLMNLVGIDEQLGMAYMFVTHDLSVVRHIADDILVMYLGQSVEKAPAEQLFRKALHPYTKALLSAIPSTDIHRPMQRIQLKGEITSPINPEPGCRFAARCPYAEEGCRQPQELVEVLPDHFVKCCRCREINGI